MSHALPDHEALLAQLRELLTQQRFNAMVVHNYCANAEQFLRYLVQQQIAVEAAMPADVSRYLRRAVRQFHQRHGHAPAPHWQSIPRAGIHALLRLVQKKWPPEPVASSPGEVFSKAMCNEYQQWLRIERGLADASIDDLIEEARRFLPWYSERTGTFSLTQLEIGDIDAYFGMRAPGLRRKSRKDVAQRLRSLVRFLHRAGHISVDLAKQIVAPRLYSYETIPSTLTADQISAVLKLAQQDRTPLGLRDYAILQLLSTYGMRAGEIIHLRLDDIDWRAETLHVRHSKTGVHSRLPLMAPVGEALLDYLRCGRPKADTREIFIRARAPYRPLSTFYSQIRRRMAAAGVEPQGKCGPHIFRHARAVSLLRASVPRKIIGDLLGHRSEEATIPYLKLATEDLRAIALEIPGREAQS